MTAAMTRPLRFGLEPFAHATNLHPDLVRRLVVLGLLEATRDADGELWFSPSQLAAAARIQRLRTSFSLNYASIGLVLDLLDRISALESASRTRVRSSGGPSWT